MTSNISAGEQVTTKNFHLVKFTIECYAWLLSSSAAVRRSSARGPKSKKFTPKFLENGLANRHHFCTFDRAQRADEVSGKLVSYLLGLGGGVPPKFDQILKKPCV